MRWPLSFILALLGAGLFTLASREARPDTIAATLLVALGAPVVAAVSLRPLAGTPKSQATATPWAWAALFGALVLCAAALVLLLGGGEPWWQAPAVGALLPTLVFAVFYALWLAPMRAIARVRAFAGDPSRLDPAVRDLVASFARPPAGGPIARRRRALRALAATGVLMDVLRFDEAAEVIARVDPLSVQGELRAALLAGRAAIALHRGDRNVAFAALKEAAAHARSRPLLDLLMQNDALLDAQDGRGAEALEKLARIAPPADPLRRRSMLVARAHALAASGDTEAARRLVTELADDRDAPGALARAAHLPGPAKPLFDEALARRSGTSADGSAPRA